MLQNFQNKVIPLKLNKIFELFLFLYFSIHHHIFRYKKNQAGRFFTHSMIFISLKYWYASILSRPYSASLSVSEHREANHLK